MVNDTGEKPRFVIRREGEVWVGWLEEYPDYRAQATKPEELEAKLKDINEGIVSGRLSRSLD